MDKIAFLILGIVVILLAIKLFAVCKRLDLAEDINSDLLHGILELTKSRDEHAERLDKLEDVFDKAPDQDITYSINAILEYDALDAAKRQRGVANE